MTRGAMPPLSDEGQRTLEVYAAHLHETADLRPATLRNYLSDLRHFAAWCEATWAEGREDTTTFTPALVATPTLTRYRAYLQHALRLKPASVNRALISLKRYFAWVTDEGLIGRNPAAVVKPVGQDAAAPRQLSDTEEEALVAAVTTHGTPRDRALIVLMLHTGLRAGEVCGLRRDDVTLGKRSGVVRVTGKRNKYREIPLNATARASLDGYLSTLPARDTYLFPSGKTGGALTARALGHLIKRYADQARLIDVSPHDLRHRFGYRLAEAVPLHRLAQIMGHDSLDTTMTYIKATRSDLQKEVEKIAWV